MINKLHSQRPINGVWVISIPIKDFEIQNISINIMILHLHAYV